MEISEWYLIKNHYGTKKPIFRKWNKDSSKWVRYRDISLQHNYNFGVLLGKKPNDIMVLDIDNPKLFYQLLVKNGYNGSYDDFIYDITSLPYIQITRKGYHIFFKYDPRIKNTQYTDNNGNVIYEWLTDGKQVLIEPSVYKNHQYRLLNTNKEMLTIQSISSLNSFCYFLSLVILLTPPTPRNIKHSFLNNNNLIFNLPVPGSKQFLVKNRNEKMAENSENASLTSDTEVFNGKERDKKSLKMVNTRLTTGKQIPEMVNKRLTLSGKIKEGQRNKIMYGMIQNFVFHGIRDPEQLEELCRAIDLSINEPTLSSDSEEWSKIREAIRRELRKSDGVSKTQRIINIIKAHPGIVVRDIYKHLQSFYPEVNYNSLKVILSRLYHNGKIKQFEDGGYYIPRVDKITKEDLLNIEYLSPKETSIFGKIGMITRKGMVLIGSKTKNGKTTTAVNIALDLLKSGNKVVYFTTEGIEAVKVHFERIGLLDWLDTDIFFLEPVERLEEIKMIGEEYRGDWIWIIDWFKLDGDKYYLAEDKMGEILRMDAKYKIVFAQMRENRNGKLDFRGGDMMRSYASLVLIIEKLSNGDMGEIRIGDIRIPLLGRGGKYVYSRGDIVYFTFDPESYLIEFNLSKVNEGE